MLEARASSAARGRTGGGADPARPGRSRGPPGQPRRQCRTAGDDARRFADREGRLPAQVEADVARRRCPLGSAAAPGASSPAPLDAVGDGGAGTAPRFPCPRAAARGMSREELRARLLGDDAMSARQLLDAGRGGLGAAQGRPGGADHAPGPAEWRRGAPARAHRRCLPDRRLTRRRCARCSTSSAPTAPAARSWCRCWCAAAAWSWCRAVSLPRRGHRCAQADPRRPGRRPAAQRGRLQGADRDLAQVRHPAPRVPRRGQGRRRQGDARLVLGA